MPKTVNIKANNWLGTLAEWTAGDHAYLSVVFSWHMQPAFMRAVALKAEGYRVHVGGPAVKMQPHYFEGICELDGNVDALQFHNPNATFTSRGCVRKCDFCIVPIIEGELQELSSWHPRPIVCDNNLLACSKFHFDRVIDSLKGIKGVDFNQGLDARFLTQHHASKIAELDLLTVRLAWDDTKYEPFFRRAFQILRSSGFPKRMIRVYVLIGYNDTPLDALHRLETVRLLGAVPYPMRYQPLKATERDKYVGDNWTEKELKRYMHYWSNLAHLGGIPFEEYC